VFKKILSLLFGAIALLYFALFLINLGETFNMESGELDTERHEKIAIFGATGTIGDGILKAALADADVGTIYVVTRRTSPRIEEGVAAGKVEMITHMDYLDYTAIRDVLEDADAVFWAIGLSAVGMDVDSYREIHLTFPSKLVSMWLDVLSETDKSFHYVSGSGAKVESRMMWAREKGRAEIELARLAEKSSLRVVSYRPSVILPTEAEANFGHRVMYAILAPIKSAVAAEAIGRAMLEVTARGAQFQNGSILENKHIVELGKAHEARRSRQ